MNKDNFTTSDKGLEPKSYSVTEEAGKAQAERELFIKQAIEHFGNDVFRFLLAITKNQDMASEVYQKTMYRFIRKAKKGFVEEGAGVKAYLLKIAFNVVRTTNRPTAVKIINIDEITSDEISDKAVKKTNDPAEIVSKNEIKHRMMKAMKSLSKKEQEAIILRYFDGKTYQKIVLALGVSPSGAYYLIKHAKDKLHGLLTERE